MNEDEFSFQTKEFKLYKNNIDEIVNDKNTDLNSKDSSDNNIKKQSKEDLSKEKKEFFDGSDSYKSLDTCDEIKDTQTQKNCLDSYL